MRAVAEAEAPAKVRAYVGGLGCGVGDDAQDKKHLLRIEQLFSMIYVDLYRRTDRMY